MFPPEIYERILRYVDSKTLIRAKRVCKQWKLIIEYLENKCELMENVCKTELSTYELYCMENNYVDDPKCMWKSIFNNYQSWQNIGSTWKKIRKGVRRIHKPITCITYSGDYIIYGNKLGKIRVGNTRNNKYCTIHTYRGYVKDIILLNKTYSEARTKYNHTHIIVVCNNSFMLFKLDPVPCPILAMDNVHYLRVYKDLICYLAPFWNIKIAKINFNITNEQNILKHIYSHEVNARFMVEDLCLDDKHILLISNNAVIIYNYQVTTVQRVIIKLPFSRHITAKYYCFNDNVVFCLVNNYLCYAILQSRKIFKRLNTLKICGTVFTQIVLHANILILGTFDGAIYIYVVKDWKNFNLKNVDKKLYVYQGKSIVRLEVQEYINEHRLLITMNNAFAKVTISN